MSDRTRCPARAVLPTGQWKTCIREIDHGERRHVWLESFARTDGRPIVVVWEDDRCTSPLVAEVLLPDGPIAEGAGFPASGSFDMFRDEADQAIADGWVDPSRWTSRWKAVLAPLDTVSGDGRQIDHAGSYGVRPGGAPVRLGVGGPIVGRIDEVTTVDGELRASGVMDPDVELIPPDLIDQLRPQVEFGPADYTIDEETGSITFTSGEVTGVALGTLPAFPEVWIARTETS